MRNDRERVQDIHEAILKIEKYSIQGKDNFFHDELVQGWILLQLQIIGEAARGISQEIREKYGEVSWRDIIDFRNLLVHEYFRVDLKLVWKIIEKELPKFKQHISMILQDSD